MGSIYLILTYLLSIAKMVIFAHFIMSWLIAFNVLNIHQQLVAQVWHTLQRILEPVYGPIRRFMPDLGGIDLSPIVALIGITILQIILSQNAGFFL